uniref:CUB domain-containing protein n=1 Tax=Caenorhabditis japonica TaxID=281687 RepID=A0A8R1DXR6_CAEJA
MKMHFLQLLLVPFITNTVTSLDSRKTIFQCDQHFDESQPEGIINFPSLPKQLAISHGINSSKPELRYNLQCVYTFVAGPRQRVILEFDHFLLSGSSENCDIEYIDIYSEIENVDEDILSSTLGGRYCGTVAPHVRISLRNVMKLVLHSRSTNHEENHGFSAKYSFIPGEKFISGASVSGQKCGYIIDSSVLKAGTVYSPTYPGTYPHNMHCSYLLKGYPEERIRLFFSDFDIFFGGEHCPYDSITIFDGDSPSAPIIRKVCGLQQRMEIYSMTNTLLIHFNTTQPAKSDPRGFIMDYEFSSRFVKIHKLLNGQKGVTHIRGTECDVRVESNRETTHTISSPNYPEVYPANTTCTYIIHGLQGEQNLENVILTFQSIAVLSFDTALATATPSADDIACPSAWVGIATSEGNMRAVMSSTDDSIFDVTLCERIPSGSPLLGPYVSEGPRMVMQFGSTDTRDDQISPIGFKATIEFRTDFGVTGDSLGTSNECRFRFNSSTGFFNSPRYPANYPLDTNCTYYIVAEPEKEILLHFEQFALSGDNRNCDDYLEVYDVFVENGEEKLRLKERYCSDTFPGPSVSAFGSHEMRIFFTSGSTGTANGFKALFEIRTARKEDVPSGEAHIRRGSYRCGSVINATTEKPNGLIISPNYPVKYNKDVHCDWKINAREGYQVLLKMEAIDVEGEMTTTSASCQKAVIRVEGAPKPEYCGTKREFFESFLSDSNTVRISFLTAPDKVNGLKGFNLSWTEVKNLSGKDESVCKSDTLYLCTYSKLCIDSKLRCNGLDNCGYLVQDDTDEQHSRVIIFFKNDFGFLLMGFPSSDWKISPHEELLNLVNGIKVCAFVSCCFLCALHIGSLKEKTGDRTVVLAAIFCGGIFVFICGFFLYLFKKKLERKKKSKRKSDTKHRLRQPYRQQKPMNRPHCDSQLSSPATSRFVHHDATGIMPPIQLHHIRNTPEEFYTN